MRAHCCTAAAMVSALTRGSCRFRQEPSAYHIWVSEIMLQQTRVAAAIPVLRTALSRLCRTLPPWRACEPDALRKLWQGLGYYNRVNNMQKAARIVCEQYGGDLPADYDALRSLPGIGDYTAGRGGERCLCVHPGTLRWTGTCCACTARLYNDDADVMTPAAEAAVYQSGCWTQMPKATPGPYNEALMELGALVCVPRHAPVREPAPAAGRPAALGVRGGPGRRDCG